MNSILDVLSTVMVSYASMKDYNDNNVITTKDGKTYRGRKRYGTKEYCIQHQYPEISSRFMLR